MRTVFIAALLLVSTAATAQTQPVTDAVSVDVCQVTNHPDLYAGKRVRVRGLVTQGYENFTVVDEHCPGSENAIWLTYGDRKESVDFDQKYAAQQIPRTSFIRDQQSERLQGLLESFRPFYPNGDECGQSCSYYKTFATVTGWFITGKHRFKGRGGLGHMGCCYLLVMEQVSDVTGVRTAVPFGGRYTCDKEEWHPSPAELAALSSPEAHQRRSFSQWPAAVTEKFSRLAEHWQDTDVRDGYPSLTGRWISSDLLRRYSIDGDKHGTTVVREVCSAKPGYNPTEITSEVLCKQKFWDPPRTEGKNLVEAISAAEQETAARKLLDQHGKSLGIVEPDLLTNTCKDEPSDNYDRGGCSFTSKSGDILVWVELGREQKRNKKGQYVWTGIPWSAYRIGAAICSE